jgi:ribonuclease HI
MMMHVYHIWLARNEARDAPQIDDPRSLARRTVAAMEDWNDIQTPKQAATVPRVEHWLKPEAGWCKANTDGAFHATDGRGGAGVVIRDHYGSFIAGAGRFFPQVFDAEGAELLACKHVVLLAKEAQVQKLVLETGNSGVRQKLMREELDRSVHDHIVNEIRSTLGSFEYHLVRVVKRMANEAAHLVAKYCCDNKSSRTWLGVPPVFIVSRLDKDMVVV